MTPALAETKLTDLKGQWTGSGTDRNLPFAPEHPARCQTQVTADSTRLISEMECNTDAGINKRIRLSIVFKSDNKFTGSAEQITVHRGGNDKPRRYAGPVTGTRTGDTAEFEIHFSGMMPNAHVVLELTSPTTFAMRSSSLGATLTNVTFRRAASR
jgi:hypothetical protein